LKIGIVTHFPVISHYIVAQRISEVFTKLGHECILHNFEDKEIDEENILFIGTVFAANLSYLARFLPKQKVVFYGTVEGFPIIDPGGTEKRIAESISIVAVSHFVKMCLETVGIPVAEIVYHGIDMKNMEYDKDFYEYLKRYFKGPVVLYISGNTERKGIDRFIIASKLVARQIPSASFILHSGEGFVNIPNMVDQLEIPNFWYTNAFGIMPWLKVNSLYKLCTVYAQPSFCGGFELPIAEAFRFNKPVIAVDAEPYNEIIENGKTGILIPCVKVVQRRYMDRFLFPLHTYRVDNLADTMIRLLSDEKIVRDEEDFRRAKERFDAENTYPQLLDFF